MIIYLIYLGQAQMNTEVSTMTEDGLTCELLIPIDRNC